MKAHTRNVLTAAFLTIAASAGAGCVTAAVSGATLGTIEYKGRGAASNVKGDPATVAQRTEAVFREMNIQTTERDVEDDGKEQELSGKINGPNAPADSVDVSIKTVDSGVSEVHVTTKRHPFGWNKDYAKEVLTKIIEKS